VSRFSLQACLFFAKFVALRWLPAVACSPNKHNAKSKAGLFASIAHASEKSKEDGQNIITIII